MRLTTIGLCAFVAACGSRPAAPSHGDADAAIVSQACLSSRAARAKAAELDHGGHELLALAKLDEANASCPAERSTTLPLESTLLANTNNCTRLRALDGASKEGKSTCDALEAPSKGTEASMRAKMREAYGAERVKDFAKAKSIYLDAWTESHPNPRALENAARMAALAGDAAESRRIRDRALLEAEAAEHAIPLLTDRVRVTRGSARLTNGTLTLGREGKVVARDLTTGELRVLLDAGGGATTLSPRGTLAFVASTNYMIEAVTVYDVLTGSLLFKLNKARRWVASPDDTLVAVIDVSDSGDTPARIVDAATGQVKTKLSGKWQESYSQLFAFSPDASHLLLFGDDTDNVFRQWDIDKGAYTGVRLQSQFGVGATSANGQYFVYVEGGGETSPLHVRDMVANKEVTQWTSRFISVEALAVSNDGKTLATGSYGSLRLWDVGEKKQLYKERTMSTGTDSRMPNEFAFSDDGKTMVLAGGGVATAWDVATGTEKPLISDQPDKKILSFTAMPGDGGVAIILEDEVRIVPASGEPRTVCKGMKPLYYPIIGPTSVAFGASGKSFACAMSDGWVHVFDTSTWAERAVVKKGPKASGSHPVDLVFSSDEKFLTVVTDTNMVTYDAQTATETTKVAFKHPKVGLMSRHARFSDGTIAVRTWNGAAAIFGADGSYQRDVKLVAGVPADGLDDFSADGKTYAAVLQKALTVVDLSSGATRNVTLPQPAKSLALSADGKSILVVGKDGVVSLVVGEEVRPVPHVSASARAWFAGASIFATAGKESLEVVSTNGGDATTLEVDADGLVVRDAAGGFEARGKPELECVVGKAYLSRETCADRAKEGLVASWLHSVH